MIDSINFIAYGIIQLDLDRIRKLGIVYRRFQYIINEYGKYDRKYSSTQVLDSENIVSNGIEFEYKNILFQYYDKFRCVVLIANVHRVLQQMDIFLSDRDKYINIINETVRETLGITYSQLLLHRIDFCVDLFLDYDTMYEYLNLLDKSKSTYKHIKRINEYETSIYLTSKSGQKTINIYDKYYNEKEKYYKEYETLNKQTGISFSEYREKNPPFYEDFKNIFRIEVQNTKALIKRQSTAIIDKYANDTTKEVNQLLKEIDKRENLIARKERIDRKRNQLVNESIYESMKIKYPKNLQNININDLEIEIGTINLMLEELGQTEISKEYQTNVKEHITDTKDKLVLDKNLYAYWSKEAMYTYYFNFLKDFLYTGTYYKLKTAKKLINQKECLSNNDKVHLKKFIAEVNRYGISGVTKNKNAKEHYTWCGATVNKYRNDLESLGISVMNVDLDKNYDIKKAKEIIDKSNHTKNWKTKLKQFLVALHKYDLNQVTASHNKEITKVCNNCKHKTWCSATVDKYIRMLERIGINPITLDNSSKFDSLESLYNLILKATKENYFDIDNLPIPDPPKEEVYISRRRLDNKTF